LKAEESFFEQPESGLREMRRSLQQMVLGMDASAWQQRPAAGREPARAETDLPPVHPVVRVPSCGGTDAVPPSDGGSAAFSVHPRTLPPRGVPCGIHAPGPVGSGFSCIS
jgi:hypothetical protein